MGKKSCNYIKLFLILLILIIIISIIFFYFNYTRIPNVPLENKNKFLNNTPLESVIIPTFNNYSYKEISAIDAKKLIDKNDSDFLIIDVSLNYNEGHIINAVNYPIANGSLDSAINVLDKNKMYLIYARNEMDSLNAVKTLADNGFDKIYRLKGNYGAWVELGYKIKNSY